MLPLPGFFLLYHKIHERLSTGDVSVSRSGVNRVGADAELEWAGDSMGRIRAWVCSRGATKEVHTLAIDLTDRSTEPNPQILALIEINNRLFQLSLDTLRVKAEVGLAYAEAANHITQALACLFEAKNLMAGE